MEKYYIRDIDLAPSGTDKIAWVWQFMPVLNKINDEFIKTKPFAGQRILVCLHLEAKTACLGLTLQAGGAKVIMVGSNPLSTQDDVCAAMVQKGLTVFCPPWCRCGRIQALPQACHGPFTQPDH